MNKLIDIDSNVLTVFDGARYHIRIYDRAFSNYNTSIITYDSKKSVSKDPFLIVKRVKPSGFDDANNHNFHIKHKESIYYGKYSSREHAFHVTPKIILNADDCDVPNIGHFTDSYV